MFWFIIDDTLLNINTCYRNSLTLKMVSVKQKVPHKKLNKKKQITKVEKTKTVKLEKPNVKKLDVIKPVVKDIKENKEIKKAIDNRADKKKTRKYVMPSVNVTEDVVNSCLNALKILVAEENKKKNAIFEDEKPIFAELHSMKIQNTKVNVKFLFAHSTFSSTGEVCLITPDIKKGRKIDHEPTVDRWEDILKNAGVTAVKTILPVRQLKVEYDQFELKRRLLTQHDIILVDTRVLSHVSHILGKMFFKKHNMLIPVRLNENKDIKKSIDIGLRTAMLRLSIGETSTVVVGHTAMPQEKVKENILSLVQQLKTKFPGGEGNIRSIQIKLPLSISLPLYLTLRPSRTMKPPKITQNRPKNYNVVEDELSTMPDKRVRVAPDGTVRLKKISTINMREREEDIESDERESDDDQDTKQKAQESDQSD